MSESLPFKYRAFLSYSHRDKAWGKWMHAALEGYRVDKDLAGRQTPAGPVPKTLRPIFRDREDFSAGHSLTEQTLAALKASKFLIIICSPRAAQSQYVNEEVRRFKMLGRGDHVIPVIVDGEPGDPARECFPPALRCKVAANGKITEELEEPIAADARAQGDGKEIAKQKVVAGLLGLGLDEIVRRAQRARKRRNRFWAALAGVFLLLAVAASGSAAYAWQQLKTNEAFLIATLKRATRIVEEAVAQAEKYSVPRTATLALLGNAEGLFDDMAQYGRPTPELRYQKAWMLIHFARNYAILGDTGKQFARANEAQGLLAALAAEKPGDDTYQRDLAVAYDEIGDVLMEQGDLSRALQAHRQSVAIMERLVNAAPEDADWQRELASYSSKVGDVLVRQGKLDDALKSHREALAIMERLVKVNPGNTGWYRDLAVPYNKIGDVLVEQGDLTGALQAYRDSVAIRERLAKVDLRNALWQRDLSVTYGRLGMVLLAQGKLDDALKTYRDGLAIMERLARIDPDNADWQHLFSGAYGRVADVLVEQGALEDALKAYRDSLAIMERLVRVDPGNAAWQWDLSVVDVKIGDALMAQGKLDDALKSYRDGLAILERLVRTDPSNALWQRDLARFYRRVGDAVMQQGKLDEGIESYRSMLAVREGQVRADPGNTELQGALALAHEKVGDLLAQHGDIDDALKSYRDGLGIFERLADTGPGNADWQNGRLIVYGKIGAVLMVQGNLDDALKSFRDSLAIAEGLAAADGGNAQWQKLRQLNIRNIGILAYHFVLARDFVRALETADQAISLASGEIRPYAYRACALMFLDRADEARALYLQYRGAKNVAGEKSWEASVLEDFAGLRQGGLTHPLMDEIEKEFAAGG